MDVSVPVYAGNGLRRPVEVILTVDETRRMDVIRNGDSYGVQTETIEGLVRDGPFYAGLSPELQQAAAWKLAPSYVIIDEGRTPHAGKALGFLAGGGLVLTFLMRDLRRHPEIFRSDD